MTLIPGGQAYQLSLGEPGHYRCLYLFDSRGARKLVQTSVHSGTIQLYTAG